MRGRPVGEGARIARLIEARAAVDGLREEWRSFAVANHEAPVFAQYEWFAAYLNALEPEPESVRFLELRRDGVLHGGMALVWPPQQVLPLGVPVLRFPRHTCLDITALPLAQSERLGAWWGAIRAELANHGLRRFVLNASGWPLAASSDVVLQGTEQRQITRVQGRTCWFDCSLDHDHLRGNYTKALKKILRHARNGLEAFGVTELQCVGPGQHLRWAFDEFLRLEASGWKGAKGSATALLLDERSRHFFEALFFQDTDAFQPEVNLLLTSGQPVAAQLCLRRGATLNVMKIAFDESLGRHSPGSLLLDLVLARECDEPATRVVSLVTGQSWMDLWNPESSPVADLWLFSHVPLARLSRATLHLRDRWRRLAVTVDAS